MGKCEIAIAVMLVVIGILLAMFIGLTTPVNTTADPDFCASCAIHW